MRRKWRGAKITAALATVSNISRLSGPRLRIRFRASGKAIGSATQKQFNRTIRFCKQLGVDMAWIDGHYMVLHPRETWEAGVPDIFVQCKLHTLKGKKGSKERDQYLRAKYTLNMETAEAVVNRCISKE